MAKGISSNHVRVGVKYAGGVWLFSADMLSYLERD